MTLVKPKLDLTLHCLYIQADKQLQLKDISPELIESAASIREIRIDQIECLRAFLDCEDLIQWIRKEVPSMLFNISCATKKSIKTRIFNHECESKDFLYIGLHGWTMFGVVKHIYYVDYNAD